LATGNRGTAARDSRAIHFNEEKTETMNNKLFGAAVIAVALMTGSCSAADPANVSATPAPVPAASPTATTATAPAPAVSPGSSPAASPAPARRAESRISYSSVDVDGAYIAITFDDGPHGTQTPRLLAMLRQRGVRATFFVVGECVNEYPDIARQIVADGHEIANHSWSHPDLSKMSDDGVRSQLRRTQDVVKAATGRQMSLLRPPYGALNERQRKWVNNEFGYKVILWSVDPLDWKNRNAALVKQRILAGTSGGGIILAHDIHKTTVDAMPDTLDQLLARGFKFVTVSELLAMEKPFVSANKSASTAAATISPAAPAAGAGQTRANASPEPPE
jgi:peptidoglycan/xylan/chitin deacetylase (PgdA/CDA1 family)